MHHRQRASKLRSRAFTLIELIVVIAVIAIAAAIVVPQAMDSSDVQAVSAARLAASDLEYARDLAITTSTPVTVTYTPASKSYTLTNTSGALIHPITKLTPFTVNFATLSGFSRVTFTASFNGTQVVTFDETGAPSNAGSMVITAGSHHYTVAVAAAIGKVSVTGS